MRTMTLWRGLALLPLALAASCGRESRPAGGPPNVVFFVGGGFGSGAWAVGRALGIAQGQHLVLDDAPYLGFLDTRSQDALVTDSAAAATEWATGRPGKNRVIGSTPAAPLPNLFERQASAGRGAGFITTTRVTHATPAPFYARTRDRGDEQAIAAQLVEAMPTVAIGGGRSEFLPKAAGGRRTDGRDLLREARDKGIAVLDSLVTPLPKEKKVLLLLADSNLPHDVGAPQPDLAELVVAAIRRLSAQGDGWFLLVEEGRIDHAGHDHDGPTLARDVLRLDRAVMAALREVNLKRTLVVVTADHGTGNPNLHERAHPESLDVVTQTVEDMAARIFDGKPWKGTPAALQAKALPILMKGARHAGLTSTDVDLLLTAPDDGDRTAVLGTAISRRFGIVFMPIEDRFTSKRLGGQTGDPVPVRAWGVRASEVHGVRDHAAMGRWLADVLRLPVTPAPKSTPAK